ncbi:unnamed protein product, partial [Closterium sp. NIES-54]
SLYHIGAGLPPNSFFLDVIGRSWLPDTPYLAAPSPANTIIVDNTPGGYTSLFSVENADNPNMPPDCVFTKWRTTVNGHETEPQARFKAHTLQYVFPVPPSTPLAVFLGFRDGLFDFPVRRGVLLHATPCHTPCHATPRHAMPCHPMPCHAMPCHATP